MFTDISTNVPAGVAGGERPGVRLDYFWIVYSGNEKRVRESTWNLDPLIMRSTPVRRVRKCSAISRAKSCDRNTRA